MAGKPDLNSEVGVKSKGSVCIVIYFYGKNGHVYNVKSEIKIIALKE